MNGRAGIYNGDGFRPVTPWEQHTLELENERLRAELADLGRRYQALTDHVQRVVGHSS